MIPHPWQLHAHATVWSFYRAWLALRDVRDAGTVRGPRLGPPAARPRTVAQLAALDEVVRAERADRYALAGARVVASPSPISPATVDLERLAYSALVDVHDLLVDVHATHPRWGFTALWLHAWGPWIGRVLYCTAVLPDTSPTVAREVHALLDPVDSQVRSSTGSGRDNWPIPHAPECPVCRQRMLGARTACPDSSRWVVVCGAGCVCRGDTCPCQMTVAEKRVPHIWPADHPLVTSALAGIQLAA